MHKRTSGAQFSCEEEAEFRRALDAIPPPPPPDGGWGWMVVLGSFTCNAVVDGICFSFGVFLKEFMVYFDEGAAKTGLVGSLLLGCYLLSGPVTSALANRYGCRRVTIAGSILATLAFLTSTCATNVGILIGLYGVVAGFGFGMIYLPAVVVVGLYFEKRRGLAMAVATCGSGVGTFVFAPVASRLLSEYDWRGAAVIVAGLALNGVACGALFRPLDDDLRRRRKVILHKLEEDKRIGPQTCVIMQRLLEEKRRQRTLSTGSLNNVVITRDNRLLRGDELAAAMAAAAGGGASSRPRSLLDRVRGVIGRSSTSLGLNGSRVLASGNGSPAATNTPPPQTRQRNASARSSASSTPVPTILLSRAAAADEGSSSKLSGEQQSQHSIIFVPVQQQQQQQVASSPGSDVSSLGRSLPKDGSLHSLSLSPVKVTAANGSCAVLTTQSDSSDIGQSNAAFRSGLDQLQPGTGASTLTYSSDRENGLSSAQSMAHMKRMLEQLDSPMYRKDILYTASVTNLPQYKSTANVEAYLKSITCVPAETGLPSEPWIWRQLPCTPKAVKDVLNTMLDFRSLASPTFFLLSFSSVLTMIGFFVPFAYLLEAALEVGVDASSAPYLISILGLANTVGRVAASALTDRAWVDCLIVNNVALIVAGGVTLLVPQCVHFTTLAIYALVYGLCIAAFISLRSVIVVELMGLDKLTSAFGQLILFQGLAITAGTPLAGLLRDITGTYHASFYMAGAAIALSGLLCFPLRRMSERERRRRGDGGLLAPSDISSEDPLKKTAVAFDESDPPSAALLIASE